MKSEEDFIRSGLYFTGSMLHQFGGPGGGSPLAGVGGYFQYFNGLDSRLFSAWIATTRRGSYCFNIAHALLL